MWSPRIRIQIPCQFFSFASFAVCQPILRSGGTGWLDRGDIADHFRGVQSTESGLNFTGKNIDTTLPAGRLTFRVLGAVAEFEREMLRERVKAGMNQARRVGKHIGRPARRRLGRAEIEKIRLLRSQGKSVRQLAKEFGASQWMVARLEPAS